MQTTKHPPRPAARIVRQFRWLRNLRGWAKLANAVTPKDGEFAVATRAGRFAGNLSSFIDRHVYLFGGYEDDLIDCFLQTVPPSRRRTVLDIGANVGTHSAAFARHFSQVHAFEPNSALWPSFERNMRISAIENVRLHKVGLGEKDDELTLYLVDSNNFGVGTLSEVKQYDRELRPAGRVAVKSAGVYVQRAGIDHIDAIKLDVQGFEPDVLRGLSGILARDRPVIWVEIGGGTKQQIDTMEQFLAMIPFKCVPHRFETSGRLFRKTRLQDVSGQKFVRGDYVLAPT